MLQLGLRVKSLRAEKAWSQEQVAQISGLSVRTIQRIENDQPASLDSQQALAYAFDITVEQLIAQSKPVTETFVKDEKLTTNQTKIWAVRFALLSIMLIAINLFTSADIWWAHWPILGMSIHFMVHLMKRYLNSPENS